MIGLWLTRNTHADMGHVASKWKWKLHLSSRFCSPKSGTFFVLSIAAAINFTVYALVLGQNLLWSSERVSRTSRLIPGRQILDSTALSGVYGSTRSGCYDIAKKVFVVPSKNAVIKNLIMNIYASSTRHTTAMPRYLTSTIFITDPYPAVWHANSWSICTRNRSWTRSLTSIMRDSPGILPKILRTSF